MDTTKKNENKKNKALYVIGSIVLTAGAIVIVPKIIDLASSYIYEYQYGSSKEKKSEDSDDWGPEIVKK